MARTSVSRDAVGLLAATQARFARQLLEVDRVEYLNLIEALWRTKSLGRAADIALVEDHWLPDDEAQWDPERRLIIVRRDVYEDAAEGHARSRFTLAHELGHCWLGHQFKRNRRLPKGVEFGEQRALDEMAANAFAAELLAPDHLLRRMSTLGPGTLVSHFGLSVASAKQRFADFNRQNQR